MMQSPPAPNVVGGVVVTGLVSRPELNGAYGIACGTDGLTRRVQVRLLDRSNTRECIGVKVENLREERIGKFCSVRTCHLMLVASCSLLPAASNLLLPTSAAVVCIFDPRRVSRA